MLLKLHTQCTHTHAHTRTHTHTQPTSVLLILRTQHNTRAYTHSQRGVLLRLALWGLVEMAFNITLKGVQAKESPVNLYRALHDTQRDLLVRTSHFDKVAASTCPCARNVAPRSLIILKRDLIPCLMTLKRDLLTYIAHFNARWLPASACGPGLWLPGPGGRYHADGRARRDTAVAARGAAVVGQLREAL